MSQTSLDPISQLALHIFRAQQSLITVGDELTAHWGMTSAKWKVLGAVALSETAPTASAIGRIMGMTRQAATKQISMLVEHGLMTPQDNPLDARAAVYTLSRTGEATYIAISDAWAQRIERVRASISDQDIATALQVLNQLVIQLEMVRQHPAPKLHITRKPQGTI